MQHMRNTQHLLQEIAKTRPLSIVMAERIATLRQWASSRTVSADWIAHARMAPWSMIVKSFLI